MSAKKPIMIGAHTPKKAVNTIRRPRLYATGREFNRAFDQWSRKRSQTMLIHTPLACRP